MRPQLRFQNIVWAALVFTILVFSWDQSVAQSNSQRSGKIRAYVGDDFANKRAEVFFHLVEKLSNKEFVLKFKDGKAPAWLRDGQEVAIRGSASGQSLAVESVTAVGTSSTSSDTAPAALAGRTVVTLLVDFTDGTHYMGRDQVDSVMFGASNSVTDMYNKSTSGLISFVRDSNGDGAADIVGPLSINASGATCDYNLWSTEANKAALAAGVDVTKFQHTIYVLPSSANCGWWGLGGGNRSWVRYGGMMVYAHELGHNLGMHHAATDSNNDGAIESEYGDYSCVMGNSSNVAGINGAHLAVLGTFSSYSNKIIDGGRGQYTVSALDQHPQAASGPQIVRLAKPNTTEYYYLTFRAPNNYGANLSSTYLRGLNIHVFKGSGFIQTRFIQALAPGETFVDTANGIEISALSQAADGSSFTFSINADCASAAPTLAVSPASQFVSPGGAASFSVSVKNNDNQYCSSTQFNLSAVAPEGFAASFASNSFSLAAGQSTSIQLNASTSLASGSGAIAVSLADNDGLDPIHASVQSNVTLTVDSFAPAAPSSLQVSTSKGKANLSWLGSSDVGSGVANYRVLRDGVAIGTSTSTIYTDATAPAGSTVSYSVVAIDRAGNVSGASNSVTVTISSSPGKGRKPR